MVSRDEIKEGLVHAAGTGRPQWGAPIAPKAFELFFETLRVLLNGGSSVVAEAAFISHLATEELRPFLDAADCRIIECSTSPEVATERFRLRMNDAVRRVAHPDEEVLDSMRKETFRWQDYQFSTRGVPLLRVDTTDGYDPDLEVIFDFAREAWFAPQGSGGSRSSSTRMFKPANTPMARGSTCELSMTMLRRCSPPLRSKRIDP